ncbi:protein NLRC3-like isoform X1, partial [Clarias magur]
SAFTPGLHAFKNTHHKPVKMSSPNDDDEDEGYQKEPPDLPAPSAVSMRSGRSMGAPIMFQQEKKEKYQKERTDSAAPSAVSMRSGRSMGVNIVFQQEQKERDEHGLSYLSMVPDADSQSQHLRPDSTASNVRVMEHHNDTRGRHLFQEFKETHHRPVKMSSPNEDDDKYERYQNKRSQCPAPSNVSMRSDKSMNATIMFQQADKERYQKERSHAPVPSIVSMRSDKSMNATIMFQQTDKERDKHAMTNTSMGLKADFQDQHVQPEYTSCGVRAMENREQQSCIRGLRLFLEQTHHRPVKMSSPNEDERPAWHIKFVYGAGCCFPGQGLLLNSITSGKHITLWKMSSPDNEEDESLIKEKSLESPDSSTTSRKRKSVDDPFEQGETSKRKKYQKKRSGTLEPSMVSMKSEWSMGMPINFQQEGKEGLIKEKGSELPESSTMSRKKKSVDDPFEQGETFKKKKYQKERAGSPECSILSMKSDRSMGIPIKFQEEEKERDKRGKFSPPEEQMETEHQPISTAYPAGNIRMMEDKEHQSSTGELDPEWTKNFKSILQSKFKTITEGIAMYGMFPFLNEIYTELYITSDCGCGHINEEHEVRCIETEFMRQYETTEESINCNEIFKSLPGDQKLIKTVLTEGIAGIGKTVSVQKFVLDWAEGKANQDFDLIFPLNFRKLNFKKEESLNLLELLHCFFPKIKELKADYHCYKILFIFDGLDESRFSLDFQNNKMLTDLSESASVDVLLTNLIKGNLLPSAFLWITSRPAASSQIPPVYIDRVTEIRGFNNPQKDEYFRKRISDQTLANKIITHLKSSRSLYIMCHMPFFCWITANVLEEMFSEAGTGDVPKTLTQMFTHFLILQIKRGSQKYKGHEIDTRQIADIVLKLAKLAFQQLEKGNPIFYEEDITECGIDVTEVTVYSGVCTQIFIEEDTSHLGKVYSFVHLSVQEHLAAVYAFLSCVNGNLSEQQTPAIFGLSTRATLLNLQIAAVVKASQSKNGHLDLFLRFLMGLSLESNSVLLQDLLTETGRRYLREHAADTYKEIISYIKEKVGKNLDICQSINLFHCLNELNDQSLVQEVQVFLSKTKDNRLSGVRLTAAQWSAVVFLLTNSEEELKEFHLQKYAASEECLRKLSPVVTLSRKAVLCDCNLTKKSGVILAKTLSSKCSCLSELDVSFNILEDSGVKALSAGLKSPHCKLEILRLCKCNITEEGCVALAEALKSNSHLRELDLRNNDLGEHGVKLLSDIKENKKCTLKTL